MNIPTSARPVPFRLLDRRDRAPARPLLTVLAAAVNVRLKIALSVAVLAAVWPALGPGGVAAAGQAAVTLGQIDAFSREGLFRGLSNPRAVSTAGGRLFVADADNNRVLIWNSIPTTNHTPPDIVVGQRNLSENEPNQGGRGAGTLNAPQGAFSDGTRLFVADSNNSRVLIWNSIPTANQAAADVVLGQRDFTSAGRGLFASMNYPMAVFSDGTRLFVTDSYNNRVLIWNNIPTANQAPADVVLGQPDLLSAAGGLSAATLNFPSAVFSDGTRLFVTDQVNHRVLIWNSIPTSNQAAANTVLGQPNFTAATQNNGGRGAGTLSYPNGVFSDGRKLFVSDGGNNRVLIWNSIPTSNQATANVVLGPPNFASDASTTNTGEQDASTLPGPTGVFSDGTRLFISSQLGARVLIWNSIPTSNRTSANVVLGQPGFTTRTSNNGGLDAGTLRYPTGGFASGARLFVADTGNNRVLIWNSIPASNQTSANVVLGQPNFTRATVVSPLAGTLNQPHGVFSDGTRLFVADTRNNRVLIWNSIPTSNQTAADVVLGQPNFNWRIENYPGLSAASLFEPIGVFSDGRRLFVADKFNNRVLIWNKIPTSNQAGANVVLGQPDFTSATENNGGLGAATLKEPAGVFSDGRRLCVADSGNHRVLIWNSIPTSNQTSADAVRGQPDFTSGLPNNGGRGPGTLSTPSGVFSDETRLFVADAENDRVIFVSDTTAPTVALTYSKDRAAVGAGELTITATFSKAIATTPTLAIQGPGDVNDQAAAGMTPTATSTVWVFTRAIATGGDGDATVTIANGQDASGNWNRPATNASFAIDATAPTFELTYSKDKAAVGAGELTITATFSEAIVTTPTLAIDGSGVANDQAVTDMTATATSTVWTFTKRIVTGGNGNATVTIANGRDAAGNENLPPTNAVFVIDAIVPAGLQILRTGAPDRVSTGQTFPVSVTLTNSGEATANVTGVRLSFRSSGGVERSSQYSLLASPALPFPLAGGETRTVTFSVKASDTASTGLLTVDASASGRDLHSDAVLFDSGGDATASLNVQRRAQLDIAMFTLPSSVVQGQRFTATLLVRNSGEASAGLSAVALAFRVAANNVGSSGFLVLSPTGISGLVSGSETVTLSLSVAVAGDVAPGTYTGHATVHGADQNSGAEAGDGNGADSPTSLQVIRFNHPPSATASSPEPLIRRGNSFVLVGSATDPDGDRPLTYTWSFLTRPAGSVLSDASFQPNGTAAAFRTSFVPDKRGTYLVRLVVSDSLANSEPVTVALTLANTRPSVSVAASPLVTLAGRFVTLSALGEDRDPEDTLTYGWRFDAVPADSARTNSDISPNGTVAAAVTGFTPDVPGTFRLSVAASDGADASIRATAEVRVSPAGTPLVFIAPVDGTTLTADLSGATGFQTRVAIETTATPGTAIELRVNGGAPISVNRPAGSDSVVFENVTLIDGRQNVLEVRFTDSSLTVRSATVSVLVRENRPPLAAIASQVTTGGPRAVELDGSGSTAESGLTLTYAWTLSRAPARAASFSSSLVTTRVALTVPGEYAFALSVLDPRMRTSSAELRVTVENEVPAAVASGGQDVVLSRAGLGAEIPTTLQIVLDGTGSSDPNGDPLTYAWTVLDAPDRAPGDGDATALVSFDSRVSAKPVITFSPALRAGTGSPLAAAGWYRFRLSVSDAGLTTSETLELRAVDPLNLLPVADAGLDRYVEVTPRSGGGIEASVPDPLAPAANSLRPFVRLDGRESADPAERAITYAWAVATRPAGSSLADVSGATSAFPTFVPDKLGLYIFQLVVNNGLYRSRPDYVNIRVTRRPPTADAFAIDRTTSQRSSVFDPVLRVPLGRRIALDGSRSLAASPADQGTLAFVWRQTGGPRVTLEPTALRSIVTFSPVEPGRVTFRLDVSDRYGSSDSTELAVDVLPEPTASVRVPELRIVSRAETSSSVGQDFGEGVALNLISLRVQTPTRVFLTGTLTSLAKAGERFDYVWKQLQGPPVLLTNSGEVLTSARESRTSFRPSTSRVHVFELRVFPLDPRGRRTALFASRFIRIVVDTPTARVPEARAVAGSLRLPTEGSLSRRTIELDATRAVGPAPGSGSKLSYTWRQISGPRGSIDAPFAVRTTFTAPEVAGETGTRLYVIELTVDSTPPGDRSEPVYLQLTQEPATPVTTGTSQPANVSFGGGGGGSGCALAPAGTSDAGACVPLFALSTMFFRNRRRRLWQRCSSVSGSGPATGSSSKPAR